MPEVVRDDPVWEGKRASEWIGIARDEADNPHRRVYAIQAVLRSGAKGLTRVLLELLKSRDLTVRFRAVEALARMSPIPRWIVPVLVRSLDGAGPDQRYGWPDSQDPDGLTLCDMVLYAVDCAGGAEKSAIPDLVACLRSKHPGVRELAAKLLGEIGREAIDAVPALQAAAGDGDPQVRAMAAGTIWKLTGDASAALAVIAGTFDCEVPNSRVAAVWILEEMARSHPDAVRLLEDATRSDDQRVRLAAAVALGRATGDAEKTAGILVSLLKADDWQVRLMAIEDLAMMGHAAASAVPVLEEVLITDESQVVRGAAAKASEQIRGVTGPGPGRQDPPGRE